jgi:hypothetical protein
VAAAIGCDHPEAGGEPGGDRLPERTGRQPTVDQDQRVAVAVLLVVEHRPVRLDEAAGSILAHLRLQSGRARHLRPQHQLQVLGEEDGNAEVHEEAEGVDGKRRGESGQLKQADVDQRMGQPALPAHERAGDGQTRQRWARPPASPRRLARSA